MDTTRWRQIEEIFHEAIGLSAEERDEYLTKECSLDHFLREEIESLISSHEEDIEFLQDAAFEKGLKVLAEETENVFPGDRIASYKIVSRLGSGGMGSVYLAIDSRLGRKVAIKFLSPALIEDSNRIRRFRQEARAASKISHPNVAAIYEIGSFEEKHFIAMEFVDGVTLRERLGQRVSLKGAIDVAIQVSLAIEAAHALGIVHRDIKPENIMIRSDGYVKVLDFGLAKLTKVYHHNSVQINALEPSNITGAIPTQPGFLMGTATYMSPEQARGLEVDARTDIWSWGVVLYEMVAGETPFQGATTSDLLADILRSEARLLSANSRTLPDSLRGILRRALAKEREERYANITEALHEVRALKKSIEGIPEVAVNELESNLTAESPTHVASRKTPITRLADITDSHVIADGFPTTPTRTPRRFSLISERISAAVHQKRWPVTAILLGVAMLLILVPAVQRFRNRVVARPPLEFTKVPIEENVIEAVLSPDGKYIASVVDEAGLQSLQVRQTNTSANLKVVSAKQEQLGGLRFSPDGDNVYYLEYKDENVTLYSISVLGGAPRKLRAGVATPVTFSPDGSTMAYIRPHFGGTSLLTSNSDGTNEKTLVELKEPETFLINREYSTGPSWSPDGKMIASPTFDEREPSKADVMVVQVADGSVRRINKQKGLFARVRKSVWLPESDSLIMTAKDKQTAPHQLWLLSLTTGEARNLTNDAEDYVGLTATRDSTTFLTTKITTLTSLWVMDHESRVSQISSTNNVGVRGFSWTKNDEIVYVRTVGNSYDLMVMKSDGGARKQLTFDGQRNQTPRVSPDGRYIFFTSYREGVAHIWRVGTDATDLKQLTYGTFEDMPALSPDGKWIVFHRHDPGGLWRMPIEGGDPVRLTTNPGASLPEYSPDGKVIAYITKGDGPNAGWQIATMPADGGAPTKSFDIPTGFNSLLPDIHWTPDGLKVTYSTSVNGISNIWGQPIGGGPPVQMTNFVEGQIFNFGWSSDGRLACVRGATTKELFLIKNVGSGD